MSRYGGGGRGGRGGGRGGRACFDLINDLANSPQEAASPLPTLLPSEAVVDGECASIPPHCFTEIASRVS